MCRSVDNDRPFLFLRRHKPIAATTTETARRPTRESFPPPVYTIARLLPQRATPSLRMPSIGTAFDSNSNSGISAFGFLTRKLYSVPGGSPCCCVRLLWRGLHTLMIARATRKWKAAQNILTSSSRRRSPGKTIASLSRRRRQCQGGVLHALRRSQTISSGGSGNRGSMTFTNVSVDVRGVSLRNCD